MITNELATKIGEILEVDSEDIKNSSSLNEFENFDSFALIHISVMIESDFHISIEPEDFETMNSLEAIVALIEERKNKEN